MPVYKYLESKDIDEVGYTLRTASLMTDPEYYFDESNPGDYPLFGIGYIITPVDMASPVAADKVGCSGTTACGLSPTPATSTSTTRRANLTATRADVGSQSTTLLGSPLLSEQRDLTVAFNGQAASTPTAADTSTLQGSPGRVLTEHADLENGAARAVVHTTRRATVVLSASYDPGWRATVNGRPAPTVMVAPALVGVVVGPGVHTGGLHLRRLRVLRRTVPLGPPRPAGRWPWHPPLWRRARRSTGAGASGTMDSHDDPPHP